MVSGGEGQFWIVDMSSAPVVDDGQRVVSAPKWFGAPLWPGTVSARATVRVLSGDPGDGWGPVGDPLYSPSGWVVLEAGGARIGDLVQLDGPGLYWCVPLNGMQLSHGNPMTYRAAEDDPYELRLWRVPGQLPPGSAVFRGDQPWDFAVGSITVSHGEFWVSDNDGGTELAVPVGDTATAGDGVIGIPTLVQDTVAGVVLSVWEKEPPAGAGTSLGSCRIRTTGRELKCLSVDGPGDAVLVLPEAGAYEVAVWRRIEPGEDFRCERYDVRVWPCPAGEPGHGSRVRG